MNIEIQGLTKVEIEEINSEFIGGMIVGNIIGDVVSITAGVISGEDTGSVAYGNYPYEVLSGMAIGLACF